MDTKRLHCKHPKKMKSSKDKQEVFVLPPDLLKKLGISIGNINVNQVIPDANVTSSAEVINNDHIENNPASSKKPTDTSILETANLMKKSVFLSPTFVPTIANYIPGEVEISSKIITEDAFHESNLLEPGDSIEFVNVLPESNNTQIESHEEDTTKFLKFHNNLNGQETQVSNSNQVICMSPDTNDTREEVDVNMTLQGNSDIRGNIDHILDYEHLLKSNNNLEFAVNSTERGSSNISLDGTNIDYTVPKISATNIISEETIPLSKLKELKKTELENLKKTTPATVEPIIESKTNQENRYSKKKATTESNSVVANNSIENDNPLTDVSSVLITTKDLKKSNNSTPDITPNLTENINLLEDLKDIEIKTYAQDSCDKSSKHLNENHNKVDTDPLSNYVVSIVEDNNDLPTVGTVNGFDGINNVANNSEKCIKVCNGHVDEDTNLKIILEGLRDDRSDCNKNKTNNNSPIETVSEIDKDNTTENDSKQTLHLKCNKQSCDSKSALHNVNTVEKRTEDNISMSKNDEDKTLEGDELTSILNATKKLPSSAADLKADKVKEIAAYLKKFSHIYTDKDKTKTVFSKNVSIKETINSNANIIESKLCIQGVEKPGGEKVNSDNGCNTKVIKTYTRCKSANKYQPPMLHASEVSNIVDAMDQDLQATDISTMYENQEFCICYDFGRLAYYDYDNLYEHIHFWHHNSATSELDLIFAIYNDAIDSHNESEIEQENKTDEKLEANNVCWNIFKSEFSDNIDISDKDLIGHNYAIDESLDAHASESSNAPAMKNEAHKENYEIGSKTQDQVVVVVLLDADAKADNILETIGEPNNFDKANAAKAKNRDSIKNTEKLLMTNSIDNNSSAATCSVDSGHLNIELTISQDKLITPIEDKDAEETFCLNEEISTNKFPIKQKISDSTRAFAKTAKKRRNSIPVSPENEDRPRLKKNIRCGLCNNIFSEAEWQDHVATQHYSIAWKAGDSINLDDPTLLKKLKKNLKNRGELKCSICGFQIKQYNRFIDHIKYCIKKKLSGPNKTSDKPIRKSRTAIDENVTCAVCDETMLHSNWLEHIGRAHEYLAWTKGQDALNLDNESAVWQHLQNIIRVYGCLTCYKCGLTRRRVKLYLAHTKTCDGTITSLEESSASISLNSSIVVSDKDVERSAEVIHVKCGVCKQDVIQSAWVEHICKEHNYLAWQEGDNPLDLDEEESVWNHLQQFIRHKGGLTCHKCGLVRRRVKLYLIHIETCDGTNSQMDNWSYNESLNTTTNSTDEYYEVPIVSDERKVVQCAVCSKEIAIVEWLQHIGKEHEYLAWYEGSTPLNLEDELAVKVHLLDVSKQNGGLDCNTCNKRFKYPKVYQQHIKECTGETVSLNSSKLDNSTTSWIDSLNNSKMKEEIVTCGVCATKVESCNLIKHIESEHQYLAWIEGQPALDFEDAAVVQKHLNDISKTLGGLHCSKCSIKRKYVKSYLQHIETCDGKAALMNKDSIECAVCKAIMEPKLWRRHAMDEHYNVAWVVGDTPIDINNPYAVECYLKEYQHERHKLVCKVCGISRVSYVGFYAHIITCGKTDEETDIYKSVCDICQNKYLIIYKSQHMTMHREKEYALERKMLLAKEKELKKETPPGDLTPAGRRKAAEKAKHVLEKYKKNFQDTSHTCSKCGFISDVEQELSDHVCTEDKWGGVSDSDASFELNSGSDDDSDESDFDSNISDEEEREAQQQDSYKKKKYPDPNTAKINRLPYQVKNIPNYMKKSTEDFIETYLSSQNLFPHWNTCELEEVPANELDDYMPPIEESCKVRFGEGGDWLTVNRLQSTKVKDAYVMFAGASSQCMSWVPGAHAQHVVCVCAHAAADAPRLPWDAASTRPGLIQLWDCGDFNTTIPQFVLGIAHNFGTVWAIDWCPSGAQDMYDLVSEPNKMHRLGLLVAACSNGSAYIFSVPYPSSLTYKEKPFFKLKPVAELRLSSKDSRKVYQATAVKWSTQKGHSHIVVGYADGTTAYYDLKGDSPLLKITENNITVFYPYHDERVQNSCIEDVDIYPSGAGSAGGAVCAGGAGGASCSGGAVQSHVVASQVFFPPHWPAALLAGDDSLVNQAITELEWWGGGRRLGGSRRGAGCAWCGRVAAVALPLLRLLRLHPAYPDLHKQIVGRILMVPFGTKRKRQNDELSMVLEPTTYEDCVKKYGIEFKLITARDRPTQQKLSATPRDVYPERFPLSDVAAMKFCPTYQHHNKLALALHAGLVFIVNV